MGAIFQECRKPWVEKASLRRWHFLFFAFLWLKCLKIREVRNRKGFARLKDNNKDTEELMKNGGFRGF